MKKIFIAVLAFAAISFSACRSTQQGATGGGGTEVNLPCVEAGFDTEEFFAGMGIGENLNAQNARMAALNAAKSMINAKIGGMAKGLATDYSRTMSGNAVQNDVQGAVEREITQVVARMLDDAVQTCEKLYRTPAGAYQSHIALRISKKELASKTASALSENSKLETLFNRDQFRKWAEEYMKGYDSNK